MHKGRKLLVSAVMAAVLALAASPITLAYPLTGSVSNGWPSGYFTWCGPGACTYWFSTSSGTTKWATTQQHSEGQTWYAVAPFEQDEFLTKGVQLYGYGIFPSAAWYSVIKWPNGSVYLSGYQAAGPSCYAVAYPSDMLAWLACNSGGFSMATSTYPPGTTESHYTIWAAGTSGGFGGVYSGSLR